MTAHEYKPTRKEELFLKYYDKLIWQALYASAHLKLWERLESYKASYLHELNQAPHFFTLTMRAHLDDALLTLSRILDRHEDSLSIWKFLNFVEQNRKIFSDQAFYQRIKENTDFKSLLKSHIPITPEEIREHRQKLGNLEEATNNIRKWRDTVLAHNDREFCIKGKAISKEHPLKVQKLKEVIDTLVEIMNSYSRAYNSSRFLEKFTGEDDIRYVMDFIRFHIQERKKQLEALKNQAASKE